MKNTALDIATDALVGAVAGAIATWAMGKATTYLLAKEPRSVRTAENKARGNRTAYGVAAQKVAMASGRKLSVKDRERLLGLTPGPTHFPWQTHARGLAGHLMFGAVADATMGVQSAVRSLA